MIMTDEQRYSAVLKELGEALQSKNTTISCLRWQIDELKEKLKAAEHERANAVERATMLDLQVLEAMCEIEELKGGEKEC